MQKGASNRLSVQGTPLRPAFSLPGSSYDNINKTLAKYFDEIEGANIETNTQMAREILEKVEFVSDESITPLMYRVCTLLSRSRKRLK